MYKLTKIIAFTIILAGLSVLTANAQTERKVIANSDGSYSVVEFPVDKDVEVRLMPMKGVNGSGTAHVMRTANGTKVVFDVTGAPSDWKDVYAYAVDPSGSSTYLGPVSFSGGTGRAEFMTPGNQFMLVLSPTENLAAYDSSTAYVFRSDVPQGLTVVPRGKPMRMTTGAAADAMSAATDPVNSKYDVPMIGISQFMGKETALRLNFDRDLSGLEAKAYIKPVAGKTQIRMHFDDMQKVPTNKRFVLWTAGPEGYTKIGQVVHAGKKDTAEIRGETALSDFGLFLTVEDTDVERPMSRVYSSFRVVAP